MTNKTRKHIWPVSLVVAVAIIGAMAAFLVLASDPGTSQAHGGGSDHQVSCDAMTPEDRTRHNGIAGLLDGELCEEPTAPVDTTETPPVPGFMIEHGGQARQVSVNWDTVTDVHEYIVEYQVCSAEPCGDNFVENVVLPPNTTAVVAGLTAGVQYQVRVTAKNSAGMVLAQSSKLVSTSRYLLTFADDGVVPSRGHAENFTPTTAAGETTTVTATVWVPSTTDDDRTDTVTVQFMSMDDTADPLAYYGIDVDDKDEFSTLGLLAVSATGKGHGELTIRPRDNNRRSFDMTFECRLPATRVLRDSLRRRG